MVSYQFDVKRLESWAMTRPSVFVGSSSESLREAGLVQLLLGPFCEVELWTQGVFGLTHGSLESLVLALPRFDFAILLLASEDLRISREVVSQVARDNVLFELGLFVGGLGRERTFMIYDQDRPPTLPSDLAGVTAATFRRQPNGNLEAAFGPPCTRILNAIERIGPRENKGVKSLADATESVQDVSTAVHEWLRLLVQSRKVELDIIAEQFGPFIMSTKLVEIRKNLVELEKSLVESSAKSGMEGQSAQL
jgi:CAP12/Pycsar effector protein, TIR domain